MHTNFKISGLTCQACKKLSEKRLATIGGVENVTVDLDTRIAEIIGNRVITLSEVNQALKGTPYEAKN